MVDLKSALSPFSWASCVLSPGVLKTLMLSAGLACRAERRPVSVKPQEAQGRSVAEGRDCAVCSNPRCDVLDLLPAEREGVRVVLLS